MTSPTPCVWIGAATVALAVCCGCVSLQEEDVRPPDWLAADDAKADDSTSAVALRAEAERIAARRDAEERGRELYRHACAPCHGRRGDGRGPGAGPLDPPPTDLAGGMLLMGDTPGAIFDTISEGIAETSMPGWRRLLSRDARWDLAAYVHSLAAW